MQLLVKFEKILYMQFRATLNCVTKILPMCSPVIGQFLDTMIVASTDKEWWL